MNYYQQEIKVIEKEVSKLSFGNNWKEKLSSRLKQPEIESESSPSCPLIVETTGRKTDRIMSLVEANQGKVQREIRLIPSLVVNLPYSSLRELAELWNVTRIWLDLPSRAMMDVSVPAVGGTAVRELGYTGRGIVIAVLDTGIYPHEDLVTPYNRILAWNDLINREYTPYDDHGHGTHVAGIIAGNGQDSDGKYTGMAPEARLVGVKVLDEEGRGNISQVIAGIEWCLDYLPALNIKVINLSLGAPVQDSFRLDPLCRAAAMAWHRGVVVCTAGGNEGPQVSTMYSPAVNPQIITVGNLNDRKILTPQNGSLNFSKSGASINPVLPDIIAPGTGLTSLKTGGGYGILSGTSMAVPLVSGGIALMLQRRPYLKPDQVKYLLLQNSRDLGLGADLQGAGVFDLEKIFGIRRRKSTRPPERKDHQANTGNNILKTVFDLMTGNTDSQPKGTEIILKALLSLLSNLR